MAKTHQRIGDDMLRKVWEAAAKAKARLEKSEANLFATFCHFANDNSLSSDAFDARTKRIEEAMVQDAPDTATAKAVRSTASSARSVVSSALEDGRTVVRAGKPVGKTRLENEKKACANGYSASVVMDADTQTLEGMVKTNAATAANPQEGDVSDDESRNAANSDSDKVMNIRDNIAPFINAASDSILADLAFELVRIDPRFSSALATALTEANQKKAA